MIKMFLNINFFFFYSYLDVIQIGEDVFGVYFIDFFNMDIDQLNSDVKGEGQFIVIERELDKDNDSETMSETSDIVNNNKMQSFR